MISCRALIYFFVYKDGNCLLNINISRMKMEQKLNTGFGTHSVQSWLPPFLVVLMT